MSADDQRAERAILELLERRGPDGTICPSEAARALDADFRPLMGLVRAAAARLRDRGLVEVVQRGEPVDPGTARGPIRLRASAGGCERRAGPS